MFPGSYTSEGTMLCSALHFWLLVCSIMLIATTVRHLDRVRLGLGRLLSSNYGNSQLASLSDNSSSHAQWHPQSQSPFISLLPDRLPSGIHFVVAILKRWRVIFAMFGHQLRIVFVRQSGIAHANVPVNRCCFSLLPLYPTLYSSLSRFLTSKL